MASVSQDKPALFPRTPGLHAGKVVGGRYSIQRVIGTGGMATIVEAIHLELGSLVAIKVLHSTHTTEVVDRFLREARAIFPLRSENVCRVLDLGRLPEGAPFIVMEYLDGTDFASGFRSKQLPPAQAVSFIVQACKGLAEAHALGIVHRDIKPANLFLTQRSDGSELVKVLDFGISKLRREGDESLTTEGQILGTPRYMAPEQFGGAMQADARADVWAVGLVLYKLIAGRLPYKASTVADIYAELMREDPEDIRAAVPSIDPALASIVMRCIEREPSKRFANARELGEALGKLSHGDERILVAAPPDAEPDTPKTLVEPPPPPRSWRTGAVILLFVIVGAIAAYAYFAARAKTNSNNSHPSPLVSSGPSGDSIASATAPVSARPPASVETTEPTKHPPPPPPQPNKKPRAPDCTTPFLEDSNHIRHPRPECVH